MSSKPSISLSKIKFSIGQKVKLKFGKQRQSTSRQRKLILPMTSYWPSKAGSNRTRNTKSSRKNREVRDIRGDIEIHWSGWRCPDVYQTPPYHWCRDGQRSVVVIFPGIRKNPNRRHLTESQQSPTALITLRSSFHKDLNEITTTAVFVQDEIKNLERKLETSRREEETSDEETLAQEEVSRQKQETSWLLHERSCSRRRGWTRQVLQDPLQEIGAGDASHPGLPGRWRETYSGIKNWRKWKHTYQHTHTQTNIYTHTHTQTNTFTHSGTHKHAHTHTHTHTQRERERETRTHTHTTRARIPTIVMSQ